LIERHHTLSTTMSPNADLRHQHAREELRWSEERHRSRCVDVRRRCDGSGLHRQDIVAAIDREKREREAAAGQHRLHRPDVGMGQAIGEGAEASLGLAGDRPPFP
jgi:hypothetical protein